MCAAGDTHRQLTGILPLFDSQASNKIQSVIIVKVAKLSGSLFRQNIGRGID